MALDIPTTIKVEYRNVDGYHIYTSKDVYGLYIADKNPETAFENVSGALEFLIQENYGIECNVEPAQTFEQLRSAIEATSDRVAIPHPSVISRNQEFVLRCRN